MEVKNTVIKCITALICVISMCITGISGTNKICDSIKKSSQVSAEKQPSVTDASDAVIQDTIAVDENDTVSLNETVTEVGGEVISESEVTTNKTNPPVDIVSSPSASKIPSTKEEIINYYNSVTAKAFKSKVGFYKERLTDNQNFDANVAEDILETFVYKFMSIGEEHKLKRTYEKGNWEKYNLLTASKLTTADITNAKCTMSGSNYKIVINLKDSSSKASKSNPETQPNAPLDKCGICYGTVDKKEYDHKSAGVIYDAIHEKLKSAEVSEKCSNAVVTAVINPSNGQLISLKMEWNVYVEINKTILGSAKATGTSHVTFSDFKY